jgi:hypothetical protein
MYIKYLQVKASLASFGFVGVGIGIGIIFGSFLESLMLSRHTLHIIKNIIYFYNFVFWLLSIYGNYLVLYLNALKNYIQLKNFIIFLFSLKIYYLIYIRILLLIFNIKNIYYIYINFVSFISFICGLIFNCICILLNFKIFFFNLIIFKILKIIWNHKGLNFKKDFSKLLLFISILGLIEIIYLDFLSIDYIIFCIVKYKIVFVLSLLVYINFLRNLYIKKKYKNIIFSFIIKIIFFFIFWITQFKMFNNNFNIYLGHLVDFFLLFFNNNISCESMDTTKILIVIGAGAIVIGASYYGYQYYKTNYMKHNDFYTNRSQKNHMNNIHLNMEKNYKLKIQMLEKEKAELIKNNNIKDNNLLLLKSEIEEKTLLIQKLESNIKYAQDLELKNQTDILHFQEIAKNLEEITNVTMEQLSVANNKINIMNEDHISNNFLFENLKCDYNKLVLQYKEDDSSYKTNTEIYLETIEANKTNYLALQKKYNLIVEDRSKYLKKNEQSQEYIKILIQKEKLLSCELQEFKNIKLSPSEINFINEKLKISNEKINLLEFEKHHLQTMFELRLNELDFFKGNFFKINQNIENFFTKSLGVVTTDLDKFKIYSLIPNNYLSQFNVTKINIIDVIYHRNWEITCYFFEGLSNEIGVTLNKSLYYLCDNLIDFNETICTVDSVSFFEYIKNHKKP